MMSQFTNTAIITKIFTGDFAFLLVFFVFFLASTAYFGRGLLVSFVISYYPATMIFKGFPFMDKLLILHGDKLLLLNKIGIFLLILVPLIIIIDRYIFSVADGGTSLVMLRNIGLSLSAVVLVVLFSYSTVNYDLLHNFSPSIDHLFGSNNAIFYWNLAPISLLALF